MKPGLHQATLKKKTEFGKWNRIFRRVFRGPSRYARAPAPCLLSASHLLGPFSAPQYLTMKRSSRVSATAPPPTEGTSPGHHTDGLFPLEPEWKPCPLQPPGGLCMGHAACGLGVPASSSADHGARPTLQVPLQGSDNWSPSVGTLNSTSCEPLKNESLYLVYFLTA